MTAGEGLFLPTAIMHKLHEIYGEIVASYEIAVFFIKRPLRERALCIRLRFAQNNRIVTELEAVKERETAALLKGELSWPTPHEAMTEGAPSALSFPAPS